MSKGPWKRKTQRKRLAYDRLEAFTERATEAVDVEGLPPIVYLPAKLRAHKMRLTIDNLRVTVDPAQVTENHLRIAEADPLGFLIAIMNGQPIPCFHLEGEGDNTSIRVEYEVADMDVRLNIATWLANRVTYRPYNGQKPVSGQKQAHEREYQQMITEAMEQHDGIRENTEEK